MMLDANAKSIKTVYVKAEQLFSSLEKVVDEYKQWTALGNIDIKTHIEAYFTEVQDWIDNFEMLRQKRKELKKLPDSTWVFCISVNLVPFKSGIDSLLRNFQDGLVDTLEDSIEGDIDKVRTFIQMGLQKLNSNPQSAEEIDQMHTDAIELGVQKDGMMKIFDGCQQKNRMIKQESLL